MILVFPAKLAIDGIQLSSDSIEILPLRTSYLFEPGQLAQHCRISVLSWTWYEWKGKCNLWKFLLHVPQDTVRRYSWEDGTGRYAEYYSIGMNGTSISSRTSMCSSWNSFLLVHPFLSERQLSGLPTAFSKQNSPSSRSIWIAAQADNFKIKKNKVTRVKLRPKLSIKLISPSSLITTKYTLSGMLKLDR